MLLYHTQPNPRIPTNFVIPSGVEGSAVLYPSQTKGTGGPFKPFFGLSGALLRRKPNSCLGTKTIPSVRADALRDFLLLSSPGPVPNPHSKFANNAKFRMGHPP